jgi:nifR3 family TIM-barrel protein
MSLRRPFFFGGLELPSNIFCAPLAGCSDLPFRSMLRRFSPGLVFCEMVKIDALIRNDAHTYGLLAYSSDQHPIGAQLCGSKVRMAAEAAKIVEDLGFDVIDLNCGCPVDKVTKDGSGSGLLKNPELIGDLITSIRAAVKVPVTVKIRAGWDEEWITAPLITKIAEEAGATAITIHGRTREQGYTGPANWDYIRASKEVAKEILVIGNGDVFDAESAELLFSHTGCDGVLVARGTFGAPWIVEDIHRHLSGLSPLERTVLDVRQALFDHFYKIVAFQSERQALLDMRRVGCWYLKSCYGAKSLRMQINRASSVVEVFQFLEQFDWSSLSIKQPIHAEIQ